MNKLNKAAVNVLKNCMNLGENEKVLIITDSELSKIGGVFLKNAEKITENSDLVKIPIPATHGAEPPAKVAKLMLKYDVIFGVTNKSISHTKARKNACEAGARLASMPGITKDIMQRAIEVDYDEMKDRTNIIADLLDKAKSA